MNGVDARRGFAVFYPANGGREGLFIGVQKISIALFGNEPSALRLPSAVFGVLTVAGLYLLGAELFGEEIGLLAAFFLATSFWHVNFSRIGLRVITAPCFLVWSLYLFYAGTRRGRAWLIALGGVVYGLGFYTYLAYRATPLLLAFCLWPFQRRRHEGSVRSAWWRSRTWLLFTAPALLAILPLALYFRAHPGSFAEYPSRISVLHRSHPAWEVILNVWRTARMFFRRGDFNWRHNVAYRAELYWPVAVFFALGIVVAIVRRRKPGYTLPLAWLAVAAIPVVLSGDFIPHALRSLLMTPAVFLLAAFGARELWTRLRLPLAAAALAALWLCWQPYDTYFNVWARNPAVPEAFDIESVNLARRIQQMPGKKVVLVPAPNPMLAEPIVFLAGTADVEYVTADVSKPQLAANGHE